MTTIPESDIKGLPNTLSVNELVQGFNAATGWAENVSYQTPETRLEAAGKMDALLPLSVQALLPVAAQFPEIREIIIKESSKAFFNAYPPAELASAFITLSNSPSDDERAGKAPDAVLFDAADVASRHGAVGVVNELFIQGYKPSENESERLVFNAMLREDPEMLRVLKDSLGEKTIRDMGDIGFAMGSARGYEKFSAADIATELNKMTPKLSELAPADKARVLGLEAQLLRTDGSAGKVSLNGVLSDDEKEVIRSTIGEKAIMSLTIGEVEQRVAAALDGNPNANLPKEKPAASPTP